MGIFWCSQRIDVKALRKIHNMKMSSTESYAAYNYLQLLMNLSIEANSVDPVQTAPVCHRGFLNISAVEKNSRLLL